MIRDHISLFEIFTSELATISLREMFLLCIKNSLFRADISLQSNREPKRFTTVQEIWKLSLKCKNFDVTLLRTIAYIMTKYVVSNKNLRLI